MSAIRIFDGPPGLVIMGAYFGARYIPNSVDQGKHNLFGQDNFPSNHPWFNFCFRYQDYYGRWKYKKH